MNKQLQDYARETLLCGLRKLPDSNILLFNHMYAGGKMDASIEEVVAGISEDKLDWAMQQVERTLAKTNIR